MGNINGPGIFLAQFLRDEAPFNNLESICKWTADLGYKGVQIPTWDKRVFDLATASESKVYCDEINGMLKNHGLQITELASHLQGQVLAMSNVYKKAFSGFYPADLNSAEITEWAADQLMKSIKASVNLGVNVIPVLSGGFAWHLMYPWPQRPPGIIDEAFQELSNRWIPVLNYAAESGIFIAYELHPGSDLFDGSTFEMFLEYVNGNEAAAINYDPSHFLLQQLDYCSFIQLYSDRIKAFHVKDAEFRPNGRTGTYGGYNEWKNRAGRFRSLGDGQVDFKRIFTLLTESSFDGWAVLEWECCIKSPAQGAEEGALFIKNHIIESTEVAFDDFAASDSDKAANRDILGID